MCKKMHMWAKLTVDAAKWYCEECVQKLAKQGKKLSHKYNLLPNAMNIRKQRGPQY